MFVKISNKNECFIAGSVSRSASTKNVGAKNTLLCEFSVYTGKKEDGKSNYVTCKAWGDLGAVLSELEEGDAFAGAGRLDSREYNGKTYEDLILDWGNSPMITADTAPTVPTTPTASAQTEFEELDDTDEGLPF